MLCAAQMPSQYYHFLQIYTSIKKKYTFSQRFPFFMDYMIVQRKYQHEYDTSCLF